MKLGQTWPKYLPLAMFAYNMFNSLNLENYSPYELTYGRKLGPLLNLGSNLISRFQDHLKNNMNC